MSQQRAGLEKRQATLQVCFHPHATGAQPKLTIIFRGTGQRISHVERAAWDPRVVVMFQENAWVDRAVALEWIERTYAPYVKAEGKACERLLLQDNLDAQVPCPRSFSFVRAHRL